MRPLTAACLLAFAVATAPAAHAQIGWLDEAKLGVDAHDITLGGAVHDGELNAEKPDRKQLGSRILFHEYVEAGFRVTPVLSLSVFLDHMSNADLARHNAGMTNVGLRTGFKF